MSDDFDPPHVRIVNDSGLGYKTKVFIDGVDMSRCFRHVDFTVDVKGRVVAQLEPVFCEIEIESGEATELVMPSEGTRELLIKYGWTPPAEPVAGPPLVRKTVDAKRSNYVAEWQRQLELESSSGLLDIEKDIFFGLWDEGPPIGEPITGKELLSRFFERVGRDWEPGEDDKLDVKRVYDERGNEIPGRREYTLKLTMDVGPVGAEAAASSSS